VRANTASRPTESFCFPFSISFNKRRKKKKNLASYCTFYLQHQGGGRTETVSAL